MTQYSSPRILLSGAMILALVGASALCYGFAPAFTPVELMCIAWAPMGVAWAWMSSEVAARRRSRAARNGEPVPDDRKHFGRLLLVSFLALLALGEGVMLAQTFGLLGHQLYVVAGRLLLVALGLVIMVWGDRRAKLVWPDSGAFQASGSAQRERRAAWIVVICGFALAASSLFLPLVAVLIVWIALVLVLAAIQLAWRIGFV